MSRYAFSHRWQMIGLALIALLALVVSSFVQAPAPPDLAAQHRPAGGEEGSAATVGTTLADVHPADRTFFTSDYAVGRAATTRAYLLAGVHPADRKFFVTSYPTGIDALAGVHPADRTFYMNDYTIVREEATGAYSLDGVHSADRKFFTNGYPWAAQVPAAAVEGD